MQGAYEKGYLLNRQSDPERIRRRTFEQFAIAHQSGRLIAFTGSYSTGFLDYPSWSKMGEGYVEELKIDDTKANLKNKLKADIGGSDIKNQIAAFIKSLGKLDPALKRKLKQGIKSVSDRVGNFDLTDLMDIAEVAAGVDKHGSPDKFEKARETLAEQFQLKAKVFEWRRRPNICGALLHDLQISRFITLNYDLELEWNAFVPQNFVKRRASAWRKTLLKQVFETNGTRPLQEYEVPGFGRVTSEILDRKNSAELSSFALHDDGTKCRILHLHGRCDDPKSMIVSRRDYRDRYWESGLHHLSFEYSLRSILSGNPILFVGIGMSEHEINVHLERYLSDNPNRRSMPMFLLWESHLDKDGKPDKAADDAFRLLYNRKLGVSVIFDREAAEMVGQGEEYQDAIDAKAKEDKRAFRLEQPIKYLAQWSRLKQSDDPSQREFRNPSGKWLTPKTPEKNYWDPDKRLDLWHALGNKAPKLVPEVAGTPAPTSDELAETIRALMSSTFGQAEGSPLLVLTGDTASGRGNWAEMLASAFQADSQEKVANVGAGTKPTGGKEAEEKSKRIVVINGSFATETDSIFAILSGAFDKKTAYEEETSRFVSTKKMFFQVFAHLRAEQSNKGQADELVIIINGMERFIASDGSALSTELDMLIRLIPLMHRTSAKDRRIIEPSRRVKLVLIGNYRLRRYIDQVAPQNNKRLSIAREQSAETSCLKGEAPNGPINFSIKGPSFFQFLHKELGMEGAPPANLEDERSRNAFLDQALQLVAEQRGQLAVDILRTLSFIGNPVENHVLPHAVQVKNAKGEYLETASHEACKKIEAELKWLVKHGVLLKLREFPGQSKRTGLHKALLAKLRESHGLPLSDGRLAASFNLGLYAAQPVDGVRPSREWHDELARIVDALCYQYKNPITNDDIVLKQSKRLKKLKAPPTSLRQRFLEDLKPDALARLASSCQSDALRAALSLMRSYFSTSSLLMHSNEEFDAWLRNAPLTDHAQRLRRIIRVHEDNELVRKLLFDQCPPRQKGQLKKALANPAFYADDLCWLYNELGLVQLTLGNLGEARTALEKALLINDAKVEFGERHHNWRRITFNRVQVAIDQGRLADAQELLREIEVSLEEDARSLEGDDDGILSAAERSVFAMSRRDKTYQNLKEYVLERYVKEGISQSSRTVDSHFPTNLILGVGLLYGYRALCRFLAGSLSSADEYFGHSIRILELLGEQRAYALFQRHRVALLSQLRRMNEAKEAQRHCVSNAGPSRQTDLDHSGRLALGYAGFYAGRDDDHRRHGTMLPQLKETLQYAIACDMYRLQIEALQLIAYVQLKLGDTDSSLVYATDALAIATRYGWGIRKVGLRALLGQIFASRNQKDEARKVFEEASNRAILIGYARGAEVAEDELVKLHVDRIDFPRGTDRRG